MEYGSEWWRGRAAIALVASALLALAGCPNLVGPQGPQGDQGEQGEQGEQGPAGPAGQAAYGSVAELPDTTVTITDISGSSPVAIGSPVTVTFMVESSDGTTVSASDLDRFQAYISGPVEDYQRVIPAEGSPDDLVDNGDGTFTYTFADPFPSVYAAPYFDSDAYGADDGELTGEAITSGTYTVGIEARRTFTVDGENVRKAGDAYFDFTLGDVTQTSRELVLEANCEACHTDIRVHGENRFTVRGCALCHTIGGEDLASTDNPTPGVTIQFATMIHKIHMGAGLPSVAATANSADPYRYEVVGFGGSLHDYSDVQFPYMPGGTGFNQQMRNCDACHGGAADEAQIYANENVTQFNCMSCHDDIDFTTGTILDQTNSDVQDGLLTANELDDAGFRAAPDGVTHLFENGSCQFCHGIGQTWAVQQVHLPPLRNPDVILGLEVEIDSVDGESGAGFFNPGDFPEITFDVVDADGNSVPIDDLTVNMVLAGPVSNYQRVFPIDGATSTTVALKGNGGVPATGTGPFTYTSPDALPANFPAPFNDSADFTFADGWGELSGLPLVDGNYTVMVYAYVTHSVNGTNYRETSMPGTFEIRIGSAGGTPGYTGAKALVTDAKCNACHGDLRIHGNTRRGVQNCVTCHTAGAEDLPTPGAGQTQQPEPDTIDWKVMIHKIHAARELSVVQNGGAYDIVGFGNNVQDLSTGILPSMVGEAANCTACHATDAWADPIERDDVAIWKVACTSCHDSDATAVHVQLNSIGITEACAACHGPGRAFSIEESHAQP